MRYHMKVGASMEPSEQKAVAAREAIREAILSIRGVLYTQVVFDGNGLSEIHVVSGTARGAKQIARDIESLLLARFDLRVDHKIISVAQMEEEKKADPEDPVRLVCDGFGMTIFKNRVESNVQLSYLDEQYKGIATGSLDTHARSRVMVEATLDAVHKFMKKDDVFSLLEFKTVGAVDTSVVMVCLSASTVYSSDLLVGTAFLKGDPQKCIINATLDAINRKMSLLMQ